MAIDERTRHNLYEAAKRALGDEEAQTLMEMLLPVGWADVATKRDLEPLATQAELGLLRTELHAEINRLLMWMVPTMIAGMSAAAAIGRFG